MPRNPTGIVSVGALAELSATAMGKSRLLEAAAFFWGRRVLVRDLEALPSGIRFGWNESAQASVDSLVKSWMLFALSAASVESTAPHSTQERRQIQGELIAQLGSLSLEGIAVAAEFPHEADARALAAFVRGLLSVAVGEMAGFLTVQKSARGVEVVLGVPQERSAEAVASVLVEVGVASADDPDLFDVADALRSRTLRARIEVHGSVVALRFGGHDPGEQTGVDVAEPPCGSALGSALAWSWVELEGLKAMTQGWMELWEAWESSDAGVRLHRMDREGEGLLLNLEVLAKLAKGSGSSYAACAELRDRGLALATLEPEVPKPPEQTVDVFARWVPSGVTALGTTTELDLDRLLSALLWQFEDQLSTAQLERELGIGANWPSADLGDQYYRHFGELRALVLTEQLDSFRGPSAWIVDAKGDSSVQFAVIGALQVDAVPEQFFERIVSAFNVAAKHAAESVQLSLVNGKADVGLPVPTRTLALRSGHGMPTATGPAETLLRVHWFVHDGFLVLSSSPKLSRRILRHKQPISLRGRKLSSYGRVEVDQLDTVVSMLTRRFDIPELSSSFKLTGLFLEPFDLYRSHAYFEGNTRIGHGLLRYSRDAR